MSIRYIRTSEWIADDGGNDVCLMRNIGDMTIICVLHTK